MQSLMDRMLQYWQVASTFVNNMLIMFSHIAHMFLPNNIIAKAHLAHIDNILIA